MLNCVIFRIIFYFNFNGAFIYNDLCINIDWKLKNKITFFLLFFKGIFNEIISLKK